MSRTSARIIALTVGLALGLGGPLHPVAASPAHPNSGVRYQKGAKAMLRLAPGAPKTYVTTSSATADDSGTTASEPVAATNNTLAAGSTINVTYSGFTAESRAAFQHAVDIWETFINSPVTIEVAAEWAPLPNGVLGAAGPHIEVSDFGSGVRDTAYPIALANAMAARDFCAGGSCGAGNDHDINAEFSSTFRDWYFGTDGRPPPGKVDFVSVVMHEIGHGLGMAGKMTVANGSGGWTPPPAIYDRFSETGGGTGLLGFANPSTALASALQSNDLFVDGPNTLAAAGTVRPRLYAPPNWQEGSSYSHWDESTYPSGNPNSLMTPMLSAAEAIHSPGPLTVAFFKDMGWSVNMPRTPGFAPADFNGDRKSDVAVYRPSDQTWFVQGGLATQWGVPGDVSISADFDGDRDADVAVFRPGDQTWYSQGPGGVATQWGVPDDVAVPADYDGDGDSDVAVYRPSDQTWYSQGPGGIATQWGVPGDIPVPADYDGDGDADVAVFRPSDRTWYVQGGLATQWGAPGDIPVPADYDGDGDADVAVYRPGDATWYVQGGLATQLGAAGDLPVPGDYDSDPSTDVAVFRPSDRTWYVQGGIATQWGASGDEPVALTPAVRMLLL